MLYQDSSDFYAEVEFQKKASVVDKVAAARMIQEDVRLATLANATAAAEFAELLPGMYKVAGQFDDAKMGHIIKIMAMIHIDDTRSYAKTASAQMQGGVVEDMDAALSSDSQGSASEDVDSSNENQVDTGEAMSADDAVDTIMGDLKNSPIAPL